VNAEAAEPIAYEDLVSREERVHESVSPRPDALDESPPSSAIPRRPRVLDGRWLPVADALALTLVWFGGHLALRSPSPHRSHPETQHDAFSYVEAALDGSWPCDGQEPFFHLECDPHASAILAEGP
jgi:hypothetical protein